MDWLARQNLDHPIIQAPMAGVTTPELAAAVSSAGALGGLGLASASVDRAREQIRRIRQLTDRPFNVNFFCHQAPASDAATRRAWIDHLTPWLRQQHARPPTDLAPINTPINDNPAMQALIREEKPPIVSFHFGTPIPALVKTIQGYGGQVLICVTTAEEAERAEAAGADALIAQGMEAGGHRGVFDARKDQEIGLMPLVRTLVQQRSLPVIAAGGLMDGTAIHAILQLGAVAAQLGTAFIPCPEAATTDRYRLVLRQARETQLTRAISGRPARGVVGVFQQHIAPDAPAIPDYPLAYDVAKQLSAAAQANGDYRFLPDWAGQGVAMLREMPAAELVATLARELAEAEQEH